MLRRTPEWEEFERERIRREPKGYTANIGVVNDMLDFVESLGLNPLHTDPLAGLDDDIRLAKALNVKLPVRADSAAATVARCGQPEHKPRQDGGAICPNHSGLQAAEGRHGAPRS